MNPSLNTACLVFTHLAEVKVRLVLPAHSIVSYLHTQCDDVIDVNTLVRCVLCLTFDLTSVQVRRCDR